MAVNAFLHFFLHFLHLLHLLHFLHCIFLPKTHFIVFFYLGAGLQLMLVPGWQEVLKGLFIGILSDCVYLNRGGRLEDVVNAAFLHALNCA